MITTTLPFKTLKEAFQQNALELIGDSEYLFVTDVSKDELWDTYINSFPESIRQEFNCNACRSFVKGYGNIVLIDGNYQLRSLWSCQVADSLYQDIFKRLDDLVTSQPIRDAFISDTVKLGTDSNIELLEDGTTHRWHHLSLQLPKRFAISANNSTLDTIRGERRSQKDVLKRSLEELSVNATQTTLELIASNSIYRGEESKGLLSQFLQLQYEYAELSDSIKNNYCWALAAKASGSLAKIRNTAIGTLLIDLSKDLDINEAVGRFERVMAPVNYKRPTPVFTKRMVEDAERKLAELGLADSLARRHATLNDLTVNNLLFVNRSSRLQTASIFETLKQDVTVNPKKFSKVTPVSLENFIKDVLPTIQSIELLLENKHQSKLVSLIAPTNPDSPSLFKWDNGFSWSYSGAYADSVKERVKKAGGQVEGQLRISLAWSNYDDLDLHLIEPTGEHISFRNKRSYSGGQLDVDMNAGSGQSREPVENIYYGNSRSLPEGIYQCYVHQFNQRERKDMGFTLEIEYDGNTQVFEWTDEVKNKDKVDVVTFSYSKATGFKILNSIEESNKVNSKEYWNLRTNQFHKVDALMFSPNHWTSERGIGNKHLFVILDKCQNNEPKVRGFFNEFLREDFTAHRKVFEALADKLEVSNNVEDKQLSGIGFSLTQSGEFYAKVKGQTERILKVTI